MVEVMIALAISSFCASLAAVIYLNIQKSSLPFFKVKAVEVAEFYMKDALEKKNLEDGSYASEEFSIKKSVGASEHFPDCSLIRIIVFDASKRKLYELETEVYTGGYK